MSHIAVIGGSLGGVRTVSGLRAAGFTGDITLVDPEAATPYDRPPLSKQVLSGKWEPARALLGDPARQWNARVLEDRAVSLDSAAHVVELASESRLEYDKLVIATGAQPLNLPDVSLEGVHVLRSMGDCLAVRRSIERGGPLVVVGGGFIGAEVASTARALGVAATIVESLAAPMSRVLGDTVGGLMSTLHRHNGVEVRCGARVAGLEGDGRVNAVRLSDGTRVVADTVVVGIGVTPNTAWLDGSGVELDDGVVCDEYCAAVNVEDIYALGDVARWFDGQIGRLVRVEHWANAAEQANTVAHNLVHPEELRPHRAVPYFWSDQHGSKLQLVGYAETAAEVTILDQDGPRQRVAAVYHNGDEVCAAFTVNWPRALAAARAALQNREPASELRERLAGESGVRG